MYFIVLFDFVSWNHCFSRVGWGQGLGAAGVVKGTVKDPSGAVIPDPTVIIYNPVTSFDRTVSTGARAASLSPTYPSIRITSRLPRQVSLPMCKTWTSTPVCLLILASP